MSRRLQTMLHLNRKYQLRSLSHHTYLKTIENNYTIEYRMAVNHLVTKEPTVHDLALFSSIVFLNIECEFLRYES